MAKDREIQKQWTEELTALSSVIKKNGTVHLYPISADWSGTITITSQANYGTGSSISVSIGACWIPHNQLYKVLSPEIYASKVSYATALYYETPPELHDTRIGDWSIQSGPHEDLDFSLPLRAVREYGFPLMRQMCSVEFALSEFKKRAFQKSTGVSAWVSYVIALEITGNHQQAIKELESFLKKNEAKGKFASSDFSLFASKFYEKFGR